MDLLQTHLKKRLDSLPCHFTWNLDKSKRRPGLVLERLERVRDGGECDWEGPLYNLLGYYYHKDSKEKALEYLQKAEVKLREQEAEGRGPRLLVNQANLAWMHYLLGELPESEDYLEKVDQLQKYFPAPPDDLHSEVYGEKAWTQMKLEIEFKEKAITNFEMALKEDSSRKDWHFGRVLAKYKVYFEAGDKKLKEEILQQINVAKTMNPDNIHLSTLYLIALGAVGRQTRANVREAYELVHQIRPGTGSFTLIFHLLRFYDSSDASGDKVLELAEKLLRKYPSEWDAEKQVALCCKRKVLKMRPKVDYLLIKKTIKIFEELFPTSDIRAQSDLAGFYDISGNTFKAEKIYKDLLSKKEGLEPKYLQLLYVRYAKHLHFYRHLPSVSINYHKKAVEIEVGSWDRNDSIKVLRKIASNHRNSRCTEIRDFLSSFNLL